MLLKPNPTNLCFGCGGANERGMLLAAISYVLFAVLGVPFPFLAAAIAMAIGKP